MNEPRLTLELSLLNMQFDNKNALEPVYTTAFSKPRRNRNKFIAKTRNIYGNRRKTKWWRV